MHNRFIYVISPLVFSVQGDSYKFLEITKGYIQTVRVAHDYGKNNLRPQDYVINSTQMHDGGGDDHNSEVLFLANGPGPNTAQSTGSPTTDQRILHHYGGNVDLKNQPDGIYATFDRLSIYKFNMPIKAGHEYTRWVVDK